MIFLSLSGSLLPKEVINPYLPFIAVMVLMVSCLGILLFYIWRLHDKLKATHQWLEHEIQEHESAQFALHENKRRLDLSLSAAGVGTWSFELRENMFIWDSYVHALFGMKEDLLANSIEGFLDRVFAEDRIQVQAFLEQTILTGDDYQTEFRVVWPNGEIHYLASRGKVYRDIEAKPIRMMGVFWDITDYKITEERLLKNEAYTRSILETANDAFIATDRNGQIKVWNRMAEIIFGWIEVEVLNRSVWDLLFPGEKGRVLKSDLESYLQCGRAVHVNQIVVSQACTKNNKDFPAELTLWLNNIGEDVQVNFFIRNISERMQWEETLKKLSSALDSAADMIFITDPQGIIEYVNPSFEHVTGYQRLEAVGQKISLLKSGRQDRAFYDQLWNTIKAGRIWCGSIINKKKDGSLFHAEQTIAPIKNQSGSLINFVSVMRDVTHQKKMESELLEINQQLAEREVQLKMLVEDLEQSHEELKKTQTHLIQTEKMAAVGRLSTGVAHEIKNPLAIILLSIGQLAALAQKPQEVAIYITMIRESAQRADKVIKELLNFSRSALVHWEPVKLHELIDTVIDLTRNAAKLKKVNFIKNYDGSIGAIDADQVLLQQVFFNVLNNAVDAIATQGNINITTSLRQRSEPVGEGEYVHIEIADDGCGMSEETLRHIYEPFYTTKPQGKGTGLGMSIVYTILEKHRGTIHVTSTLGKGTVCAVTLPVVCKQAPNVAFLKSEEKGA
jgi:PAS domain S-box-containing protein